MSNELEILGLLKSGQAFNNDLLSFLTNFKNLVNFDVPNFKSVVDNICDTIWPSNVPYVSEFTTNDLNVFNFITHAIIVTLDEMINHTNLLSGKVINGEKNIAAIIDLTLTAKETNDEWNVSKNINTHPLYESASVLFRKEEILSVLTPYTTLIWESLMFFFNTADTKIYLQTITDTALQKSIIRGKLDSIISAINFTNSYLRDILNHDNNGWAAIQSRVFLKLFAIKLDGYASNVEASQYIKLVAHPNLKKYF